MRPPVDLVAAAGEQGRNLTPLAEVTTIDAVVQGNQAFAFTLYQELRQTDENLLFSPLSIAMAMAMVGAGARNQTAAEIATVMHFPSDDILHPTMNWLDLEMAGRTGATGQGPDLSLTNSLWLQSGLTLLPAYPQLLAENYGTSLNQVDFNTNPDEARELINEWVANQTNGNIRNVIAPPAPSNLTRLMLINTIQFKALWQLQFDPSQTVDQPFNLLNGQTKIVPMMTEQNFARFPYVAGDGFVAVELLYDSGSENYQLAGIYQDKQMSMILLVPDAGNFVTFEQLLDAALYQEIVDQLVPHDLTLFQMPRFQYDAQAILTETLADMGMATLFDPAQADLSGMTGTRDLFVRDVIHQTRISVDEAGSEASGVTAVEVLESAMEPASLIIDRPFIYIIHDIDTGAILFVGRVLNP